MSFALWRVLQEILTAEPEREISAIIDVDTLDALPPRKREQINETLSDAAREWREARPP